jgi:hypothetical protein
MAISACSGAQTPRAVQRRTGQGLGLPPDMAAIKMTVEAASQQAFDQGVHSEPGIITTLARHHCLTTQLKSADPYRTIAVACTLIQNGTRRRSATLSIGCTAGHRDARCTIDGPISARLTAEATSPGTSKAARYTVQGKEGGLDAS